MRFAALLYWCGCLSLATNAAMGQESELPPEFGHSHAAAGHSSKRELTAEDVPDHEPRLVTRWRIRPEYMLWLPKKANTPPLISTGLNTDPGPGVIGSASGRVVYGGDIDLHERHGGMFTLGYALDDEDRAAFEATYGFAGTQTVGFHVSSLGSTQAFPVLARPFFNVNLGQEDASLIAFPGLAAGSVDIRYRTFFDTAELNGTCQVVTAENGRIDLIGGFRVFRLEETLSIEENVAVNASSPRFPGRTIRVRDVFDTDNTFYGCQLGVRGLLRRKRFELEGTLKAALGIVDRELGIEGLTTIDTNPPFAQPAGLLALASNRGRTSSTDFAVLPEASIRLGYRVTEHFQVHFGYTFLLVNPILRPGDQVDRNVNVNLVPTSTTFGVPGGPLRPAAREESTDFWVHGFRFGFEFRF